MDNVARLNQLQEAVTRANIEASQSMKALAEDFDVSSLEEAHVLLDELEKDLHVVRTKRVVVEEELAKVDWGKL